MRGQVSRPRATGVAAPAWRVWALALPIVAASAPAAAQGPVPIAPGDVHRFRAVGEVDMSPDGRLIAYVVTDRSGAGRPASEVWVADVRSGESRRLPVTGGAPRLSPDGRWLAMSGTAGGQSGLVIVRPDGSEAHVLAELRGTNHPLPSVGQRIAWSPDGRYIAYVSATDGPEPEESSADADPIVIRRYLYRTTGSDGHSYFNDNRRLHIFVVDVETGQSRQLTDGPYYEHSIDWSPRGDEILFVSNRDPDERRFNYDIFAVRVEDGRIRRLIQHESVSYRPRWSPDGTYIAYQGTRRGLTSSETTMEDTRIWIMRADGSGQRELAPGLDNRHGAPAWSRDGRYVYFTVATRGSVHLYRAPVAGGAPERVVGGSGRVGSWAVGPNQALAYAFRAPDDLAQLHHLAGGRSRQLTHLNAALLRERWIAPVESFTFVTFDGLEVEAFLTHPYGRREGTVHPLIVMIKGGPHSQQGPILDLKAQAYAGVGWAVLMVNYRGSVGYGQAFADAIFGDQNGREAMDVLQGVDAALRRYPWLDGTRVGVEGGSYGGQLTNWLITQTDRFRAAIPRAGIANLVSFNYLSYYHDYLAVEFGGYPHQGEIMDRLWQRSPIRYVAQVRTPTMLVHGLNDYNVPRAEAEQFYIALRDVGVEAELVLYPRAGHGIAETGQIVDLTERSIAWYRRHFEAAAPSARAAARD